MRILLLTLVLVLMPYFCNAAQVRGYYRKDGTYVRYHYQKPARMKHYKVKVRNVSTKGALYEKYKKK